MKKENINASPLPMGRTTVGVYCINKCTHTSKNVYVESQLYIQCTPREIKRRAKVP